MSKAANPAIAARRQVPGQLANDIRNAAIKLSMEQTIGKCTV
jgi:hypothetical protein